MGTNQVPMRVEELLEELGGHFVQRIHWETFGSVENPNNDNSSLQIVNYWLSRVEPEQLPSVLRGYIHHIRANVIQNGRLRFSGAPLIQNYALIAKKYEEKNKGSSKAYLDELLSVLSDDILLATKPIQEQSGRDKNEWARKVVLISLVETLHLVIRFALIGESTFLHLRKAVVAMLSIGVAHLVPNEQHFHSQKIDMSARCAEAMNQSVELEHWVNPQTVRIPITYWDGAHEQLRDNCWCALSQRIGVASPSAVIERLGWLRLAKDIRRHFFDRAEEHQVANKPLTYPLIFRAQASPEPVYKHETSRIVIVAQFLQLMGEPSKEALCELMPIFYALLDSHAAHLVVAAVNCLWPVIDHLPEENHAPLVQLLLHRCQTCRNATPLGYLCALTAKALCNFPNQAEDQLKFTLQMLEVVFQNSYAKHDPKGLLLAIMVGALVPMLELVSAPEIGRPALKTLLPLISENLTSRTLQVASLVVVINLLSSNNLARHGGKIMASLLACWTNGARNGDATIECLCSKAASLTLRTCGSRAEEVVNGIRLESKYQDDLVELAHRAANEATRNA